MRAAKSPRLTAVSVAISAFGSRPVGLLGCRNWVRIYRCSWSVVRTAAKLGENAIEIFDVDGLHEVRVEPGFDGATAVGLGAVSGQRDQADAACGVRRAHR